MKPRIEKTRFGSITIGEVKYQEDSIITLNGEVRKRKKKLSKEIFGTSHILSLPEAEYIYEDGLERIIIGRGQSGMLKLSPEAIRFFDQLHVTVELLPTPEAILRWNEVQGKVVGLFHLTC